MFWLYAGFITFVLGLLALDLGVFHKKAHVVSVKEALGWSAFWISLGLAFVGVIYLGYDRQWFGLGTHPDGMTPPVDGVYNDGTSAAIKYLTGFVVEKSLAVDNLFVIAMVFGFCGVPAVYQHRVLFWGIIGALVMRGVMIGVGAVLVAKFSWILYLFGGFLLVTGIKMLLSDDKPPDFGKHWLVRAFRRVVPMTDKLDGGHFWTRAQNGMRVATPLLLALLLVELTDVVFAVDSIPAVFAITTDPFLVFTSNVFAILGLRSLFFALSGMLGAFRFMKVALSAVLVVIGVKMLAHSWLKALLGASFNWVMLGVVAAILAAGVIASLLVREPPEPAA